MAKDELKKTTEQQSEGVAESKPEQSARKEKAFYYPEHNKTVLAKDRKEADNKIQEILKSKDQK